MSDFKSRLLTEKSELDEKIEKLSPFIQDVKFQSIDPLQQELLLRQLPVMQEYSAILNERISIL